MTDQQAPPKDAVEPSTRYMFRLPNGIVHQGSDLGYIAKTYPDAVITDRVTTDEVGQAVFHPFTGKQPFERAAGAAADDGEAQVEGPQTEVERAEGDQVAQAIEAAVTDESPVKARSRR